MVGLLNSTILLKDGLQVSVVCLLLFVKDVQTCVKGLLKCETMPPWPCASRTLRLTNRFA